MDTSAQGWRSASGSERASFTSLATAGADACSRHRACRVVRTQLRRRMLVKVRVVLADVDNRVMIVRGDVDRPNGDDVPIAVCGEGVALAGIGGDLVRYGVTLHLHDPRPVVRGQGTRRR
eukprot:607313-Prymnesium_polylepis.1